MQISQINTIAELSAANWNALAGPAYPFMRHEFLLALERSGAVSAQTGWQPAHLLVTTGGQLQGVLLLYLKQHSWGEYVFDQQWAQAYRQYGLNYYPKLVSALPFTPCAGPRLLLQPGVERMQVWGLLMDFIKQLAVERGLSSWHCLFPESADLACLQALGLSIRAGVQFQWFNQAYQQFDDFLAGMTAAKRKMLKRERRRVAEQDIRLQRIAGPDIKPDQWRLFYRFYADTYLKKGSQPYLSLDFFLEIAATMPEYLLLVLAEREGGYIAAALSFTGVDTLYGRYWGCADEYDALHFEACYYQGLEHCIEQGLVRFDSGAQGEHKIARGFAPVPTYSAHWLQDPRFAAAVADFVQREQLALADYRQQAQSLLPFRVA